jgi:hypothetical protein
MLLPREMTAEMACLNSINSHALAALAAAEFSPAFQRRIRSASPYRRVATREIIEQFSRRYATWGFLIGVSRR